MKKLFLVSSLFFSAFTSSLSYADNDPRKWVELPEKMQRHMMSNMRHHLVTINKILIHLRNEEIDLAAEIAEKNLGMSSLGTHGASHMGKFMPEDMRLAGTNMHRAASRFAKKAQAGEIEPLYKALTEVTSACVACHSGYRVRLAR